VPVEDVGDDRYEDAVRRAAAAARDAPEPATLKSHSTCAECPFYDHCWPLAVAERRIEVLGDVWTSVAQALHDLGLHTIEALAGVEAGGSA